MCGIIGYIGSKNAVPILIDGLRRLEYRGYDSAGIALENNGAIELRRSAGKLARLEETINRAPINGTYGIGHTRWATHGRPTEENAHPHRDCTGRIVVVHNGIIENYLELKHQLQHEGHTFLTDTDTEVVAHLIEREMQADGLENAARRALVSLRGLFGLVLISADDPDKIIAIRNGPPIVIGLGDKEYLVASDTPPLLSQTRNVVFLGDEEMAILRCSGVEFTDYNGRAVSKVAERIPWDPVMAEKAGHKHFMLKEIFEQPWAAQETILGRISLETNEVFLGELEIPEAKLKAINRVLILACGTSWHAGLIGKFFIEQLAHLPVEVDYGSEYRYRNPIVDKNTLAIVITQSGETADTLAALKEARMNGATTVAICNVTGSMATREATGTVYTHAGPEIGVASTKAFTSQLIALYLFSLYLGRLRSALSRDEAQPHIQGIASLPVLLERTLRCEPIIKEISSHFYRRTNFLYLGRGTSYPIALEGALKLKEVSYIHAEGYPAGEIKHGPIALIDESMPIVIVAPNDQLSRKIANNLQEVKARSAAVIAITNDGHDNFNNLLDADRDFLISVPDASPLITPILMVIPLQLLAYHIAVRRGCDVDQPRNLAKSVTVE